MAVPDGANSSRFAFVEQDLIGEIEQSAAFIFATQPGQLVDDPELGLPEPIFHQGGVTVAELEAAVNAFEPRAKLTVPSESA